MRKYSFFFIKFVFNRIYRGVRTYVHMFNCVKNLGYFNKVDFFSRLQINFKKCDNPIEPNQTNFFFISCFGMVVDLEEKITKPETKVYIFLSPINQINLLHSIGLHRRIRIKLRSDMINLTFFCPIYET